MQPEQPGYRLSEMVRAGRFFSREEAEGLAEIAADCGVFAPVVEPRRLPQAFDGTLGGLDAAEGFLVYVKPDDLPRLREHLVASMSVEESDPMLGMPRAALKAMADGQTDCGVLQQAVAAKILAARPPEDPSIPETILLLPDPYAARDARLARWIALFAVLLPLLLIAAAIPVARAAAQHPKDALYAGAVTVVEVVTSVAVRSSGDASLGGFAILVLPLAAGATLVVSRRRLPDGRVRRMFPPLWRWLGGFALLITFLFLLIPLAAIVTQLASRPPPVQDP